MQLENDEMNSKTCTLSTTFVAVLCFKSMLCNSNQNQEFLSIP